MILITPENYSKYFIIEKLNPAHPIGGFNGDNANEYTLVVFLRLTPILSMIRTFPFSMRKMVLQLFYSKRYTKKTHTLPMWTDIYP
jgi:hypothetical protein